MRLRRAAILDFGLAECSRFNGTGFFIESKIALRVAHHAP
jgi:hypothetical protein